MSSEKACLEFQNIGMEFPGVKALSDVSFSIGQGEIHALMGANGAGKSTTDQDSGSGLPTDLRRYPAPWTEPVQVYGRQYP